MFVPSVEVNEGEQSLFSVRRTLPGHTCKRHAASCDHQDGAVVVKGRQVVKRMAVSCRRKGGRLWSKMLEALGSQQVVAHRISQRRSDRARAAQQASLSSREGTN